jgi:Uma2 family endonuclease
VLVTLALVRRQFSVHDYARMREVGMLPRYAQAHISEVWIIVNKQVIEQYTQPQQGQYTRLQRVLPDSQISAVQLPGVQFTTDQIF